MTKFDRVTRQRGSVLFISLVMLIVLTLLGIAAIRLSIGNLLVVNSMQARQDAIAAAQVVLNQVLSTSIVDAEGNITLSGISTTPYSYSAGNGKTYSVTISAPCLKSMTQLTNVEVSVLEKTAANFKNCRSGSGYYSDCYRTTWNVDANVTSGFFGARASITQGMEVVVGLAPGAILSSSATGHWCST